MTAPTGIAQRSAAPYRRRTVITVRKNTGKYGPRDKIMVRAGMNLRCAVAVLAPQTSTASQKITIEDLLIKAGFDDGILDFSCLTKTEEAMLRMGPLQIMRTGDATLIEAVASRIGNNSEEVCFTYLAPELMTEDEVKALTHEQVALAPSSWISRLSPERISQLHSYCIEIIIRQQRELTPAQIGAITPEQISGVYYLQATAERLLPEYVSSFRPETFAALLRTRNPRLLTAQQIRQITPEQVRVLAADGLSFSDFFADTEYALAFARPEIIWAIPPHDPVNLSGGIGWERSQEIIRQVYESLHLDIDRIRFLSLLTKFQQDQLLSS